MKVAALREKLFLSLLVVDLIVLSLQCTILTDAVGFFPQSGGINSVQCRRLCPNNVLGSFNHTVQDFVFGGFAVGKPHCCTVGQNTIDSTPVKVDCLLL